MGSACPARVRRALHCLPFSLKTTQLSCGFVIPHGFPPPRSLGGRGAASSTDSLLRARLGEACGADGPCGSVLRPWCSVEGGGGPALGLGCRRGDVEGEGGRQSRERAAEVRLTPTPTPSCPGPV